MARLSKSFLLSLLVFSAIWASQLRGQDGSSLTVSPASLSFVAPAGSATIVQKTLTVSAARQIDFTPSASGTSGSQTWLTVKPTGTLATPHTLTIAANPLNLPAGTYTGTIHIRSEDSDGIRVPVTFTVKGGASLSWAAPKAIIYGTALGAAQLNATSTVAGSYQYTPMAGTVLGAGTHVLSVKFTPTDTAHYPTATATVQITVNRAVLTVTAGNATRLVNSPNPAFTATITGFVNGDTRTAVSGTASLSTTATTSSPAGSYPIVAAIGTLAAANYVFSFVPGTLTISQPGTTLTVSPATLSFTAISGGASPISQSLSVSSTPNAAYTAKVSGAAWLSVLPVAGTTPATLAVSASVTGLAAGTFTGNITVTGNGKTSVVPVAFAVASATTGSTYKLIGWNDLGMHCFDGKDYSVFGVLPPYNTIHAHLINTSGSLVTSPTGYKITYHAIADPLTNTINTTSASKTNFWNYVSLLGLGSPVPDTGLTGNSMPGTANTSQPMSFNTTDNTWLASGIPMTPFADNGTTNYFPMMRLTAQDSSGAVLATTDIVLPTSDEMSCNKCHASGSNAAAMPSAGWAYDPDPAKDTKLNILRKHDDRFQSLALFQSAATQVGYSPSGLVSTVATKPVLCYQCHQSNALGMAGVTGIKPLTTSVHGLHASVIDPATGATMDSATTRATCYSCHPGPKTKCLRGAMGNLLTSTGANAIECQNCHGNLTAVANPSRSGWLNEPTCQSCHSGLASASNTTLAYTSAFSTGATLRTPADTTFASNVNTPSTGLSLYRFSSGHGGLQCESCHGSTHAEFPTSIANDNVQSIALQGHSGTLSECSTCHATVPTSTNGGPHGLHPIGASWVNTHQHVADSNGATACQGCHGTDYRGTILSRIKTTRTLAGKSFAAGTMIGCYSCHNGPNGG